MKSIKVSNGYVRGNIKNILGTDIVEFVSIPYCEAPTNEQRFRLPKECNFVDRIINQPEFISCPPQLTMKIFDESEDENLWIPNEYQSEDCLYLNIWCPLSILEEDKNHPVFVWIYGGGFVSGSSSLPIYNGSLMAAQEHIIVVSFNYRVGLLGFLCLDEDISGNQGIYDQVAALKWTHENIINFKGNPDDITLGGNSAGGCSVTLHLLIEESWKYFSKIIVQSGVCLSDWAFHPKHELIKQSEKIVNELLSKHAITLKWNHNLKKCEKEKIVKILQDMDFNEFLDESILKTCILNFSWLPCNDGKLIKDYPENLFKMKKFKRCPSIFLNVENESTYFLLHQFPSILVDGNNFVDRKYMNECLNYYRWYPNICPLSIKESIANKYNIKENENKISIIVLDKILSDRHFVADSVRLANYVSDNEHHVFYLWHHVVSESIDWPDWVGTMHSDEIYLLFGYGQLESNGELNKLCQTYMENIGYFIKNGTLPNGLPHYDSNSSQIILVENDHWTTSTFTMDQKDKFQFWENLRMQIGD